MKKCKCNDEACECMEEEVLTKDEKKKKVGIIVGIGTGIAAIGAAVAGILFFKKKKEEKEETEDIFED